MPAVREQQKEKNIRQVAPKQAEDAAMAWLNSPFTRTPAELAKDKEVIDKHVKWLAEHPLNS